MNTFFKNELTRLFLFVATCVVIAAIFSPYAYTWGRGIGNGDGAEWLGSVKRSLGRADLDRYFNRVMMLSAVVLLYPFIKSLQQNDKTEVKAPFSVRINPRFQGWKDMLMGFVFAAGYMGVFFMVVFKFGWIELDVEASPSRAITKAITPAIIVSLIEEWLFRGVLFALLLRTLSAGKAVIGLSLFFALVHFLKPYHGSPEIVDSGAWNAGFILLGQIGEKFIHPEDFFGVFLTLFLVGVILAVARYKTGYLWMSIGLHAGWVFALKIYLSLTDNTGAAHPVLYGSDIREGLVPMVFVLLTGLSVIMYLRPKQSSLKIN